MKKTFATMALTILAIVSLTSGTTFAQGIAVPTEAQVVELFPNAAKVDGVAVYLFAAKSLGVGPSYSVAKIANLVSADVQFATITKGGSYFGVGVSAQIVDIIRKFGREPLDAVITFNPSIGVTGGWRTGMNDIPDGIDGGIRANVLNVDLAKMAAWFGL